jgi:CheY-like chemotaxis protein
VQLASLDPPHLILLDMEMPRMDGAQTCEALRRVPALMHVPIIVMSATDSKENRERCHKAGCTEFVIKPEQPDELLGIVARILSLRQREAVRITVVFNVTGAVGARQVVGQARDLSATGMLLETPVSIAVGTKLPLEFYLPRTRAQIKVTGTVLRSTKAAEGAFQSGIRFVDLSQSDQELILDYVAG